jgi:hypothetical protein
MERSPSTNQLRSLDCINAVQASFMFLGVEVEGERPIWGAWFSSWRWPISEDDRHCVFGDCAPPKSPVNAEMRHFEVFGFLP